MAQKLVTLFLLIFVARSQSEVETRFFNLPIDHFSTIERRTFDIRYFVNEQFYRENGPVFILTSYGQAATRFITEGNMFELAESEGGVLIALEMRYFGQSLPTSDASFENLQWLTVHQIVADIGRFANFVKRQYSDAPVILWGSGRGGALAIWARQKFPNVIDGAWGSSAILDAILEDLNFLPNTFNTIAQVGGEDCGQILTEAFDMIEEAFQFGNTTRIEERFNTCGPFDVGNAFDLARFINNACADIAFNFLQRVGSREVEEKCNIMRGIYTPGNLPEDALEAFARWYVDFFHVQRGTACIRVNNTLQVEGFQDPSWEGDSTRWGSRQWHWLTCTQFGQWFVSNDGQGHPFGTRLDLRFMQQWCADAFGDNIFLDQFWKSDIIRDVQRIFGGLNPGVTRIFITHGEMDPQRSLGPFHDLSDLSPVVVMPLQSHARDLEVPDLTRDSAVLFQTKLRIQDTIREWIQYARGEGNDPNPPTTPQPPAPYE